MVVTWINKRMQVDLPLRYLFPRGLGNLKFAIHKSDCNLNYRHQPQHGYQFGGAVPVVSGELDWIMTMTMVVQGFLPAYEAWNPMFLPFCFFLLLHSLGRKCAGGVRNLWEGSGTPSSQGPRSLLCWWVLMPRQHLVKEGLNLVLPLWVAQPA